MNRKASYVLILTMIITLTIFFIQISPANGVCESDCSEFVAFVKEIFENVRDLSENQCRYNATDSQGYRLDTIKTIENPNGGYLGVYHFEVGGSGSQFFQVRLANSTDLLHWIFIRTIEGQASQPTIARAPNDAYLVAFEKHMNKNHSLGFHYYSNLTSLLELAPELNFTVPHTLGNSLGLEGTPNFYNITIVESELLRACVGFHFNNGTDELGLDRVAVGFLNITLNPPRDPSWEVKALEEYEKYNEKLEQMGVKGHIGDRDYGQIFGRNFTLQEGQYVWEDDSTWNIFLYDHSTGNFTELDVKTHKGSTSFSNPAFTFLKSPSGRNCIVVTYFLHSYNDAAKPVEAGELIFYKEFDFKRNESYSVSAYSNSTISSDINVNESKRIISFNITGPDNSKGFCIVKIPRNIVQDWWQCNYSVLLNGEQWPFENWTCTENTYIYVNYIHPTHEVVIIPEFPSFLILLPFMIATLLSIIFYRKKTEFVRML